MKFYISCVFAAANMIEMFDLNTRMQHAIVKVHIHAYTYLPTYCITSLVSQKCSLIKNYNVYGMYLKHAPFVH